MTETVELNYIVDGEEGPWITLGHSLASDLHLLDAQAVALSRHFRVLRFDIRGHGRSSAPPPPYRMEALAQDVQALLDRLGIKQTAWLGVSLGGMIGLTHALMYPGFITRMIVADTTSGYPAAAHQGWRDRIALVREHGTSVVIDGTIGRWFTPGFLAREPKAAERFGAMISATPSDGFIGCCEAILSYSIADRLSAIGVPVLVIVGAEDQATPPAMAQALASGIAGARCEVIEDAAHQSNIEQPAVFNALVEKFLDQQH